MRKFYLLFVILFALPFLAISQIVSSGFESWTGTSPDGWRGAKTTLEADSSVAYTTSVHGGTTACKLINRESTHKRFTTAAVSVQAGTTYTISFWVRGHGNIRTNIYDARTTNSGYATYNAYLNINSSTWTQYSQDIVCENSSTAGEFIFSVQSTVADLEDLQIDDVNITVASSVPSLTITSPVDGGTIYNTSFNLTFDVGAFTVGNPGTGANGHIHYTVDNGSAVMIYNTNAIPLTLTEGAHQIIMTLVDDSHVPIVPAVADTADFTISTATVNVANIAALRASNADGTTIYKITGEAVLTFKQTFRNQKFVEDATAAIMLDDLGAIVTSTYNVGDGITNITGKLSLYNNMLQFVPVMDPGAATSTANVVDPTIITINDLANNFDLYESQLVTIENIKFKDANGTTTFANGLTYAIANAALTEIDTFRTSFYDMDYIGQIIPSASVNLTGILNARINGNYITARNNADIEVIQSVNNENTIEMAIYPNPATDALYIKNLSNTGKIEISNILGQVVYSNSIINSSELKVDLKKFNCGQYILTVYDNNQNRVKTVKFTKE